MTENPAVAERAALAWAEVAKKPSILRTVAGIHPMPPGVALDMVMGDDCERDDAVSALLDAAATVMEGAMPAVDVAGLADHARFVTSHVRGESFGLARVFADQVASSASDIGVSTLAGVYGPHGTPDRPDVLLCDRWRLWAVESRETIKLCEAIVKAAYPD